MKFVLRPKTSLAQGVFAGLMVNDWNFQLFQDVLESAFVSERVLAPAGHVAFVVCKIGVGSRETNGRNMGTVEYKMQNDTTTKTNNSNNTVLVYRSTLITLN